MATARQLHYTYVEYLAALEVSEIRLEYLDGEIFAMAGGTPEHGMIAARIIQRLGAILPPSCRVMTSDVKIRVLATGLSTFPDVSAVCGPLERAPDDANAVVNPAVLAEVLSASTADYDRGEKLRHYQQIASLRVLLLVDPATTSVTVVRRDGDGWLTSVHDDAFEVAPLGAVSVRDFF